ncbi:MAG: NAD(P)-dependent glycerol-3-phosphate dehydrogenase [Verrucomicrobiales bacterium]|nr:NAD(P)-dependent glycerol-3-phosphate dehydrogenase [Verrucomicrobiales bacterium]HQW30100.1 NAD(P)H-dependent glycerol-3-phosphate dehydrogenase [Verrucomicrobiales bacterium]
MMTNKAAVLGAGSWGTGLSIALADSGREVTIFGNNAVIRDDINLNHRNSRYLPDVILSDRIRCTTDIADLKDMPVILLVVPSQVARLVLGQLAEVGIPSDTIIVSCTKGIDPGTGKLMHELIREFFPETSVAVLSGPSHAEEVAKRKATLATIGSEDPAIATRVQEIFALPWFRTYTSSDVIGIELGGVVKNVFAIAAGAIDGLGLGDNAKAAMVTRGLAEMTRLGIALGAREETFRGLSGIGDLVVTCYSVHSRNNRVGRMLGSGKSLEETIAAMNQVAEGVPNAKNAYELARKLGVRTPLIDQAYAVLYQNKPPADALRELLTRDQRSETD